MTAPTNCVAFPLQLHDDVLQVFCLIDQISFLSHDTSVFLLKKTNQWLSLLSHNIIPWVQATKLNSRAVYSKLSTLLSPQCMHSGATSQHLIIIIIIFSLNIQSYIPQNVYKYSMSG